MALLAFALVSPVPREASSQCLSACEATGSLGLYAEPIDSIRVSIINRSRDAMSLSGSCYD